MALTSFDPLKWVAREDALAARVLARHLRGVFTRSIALPGNTMALLVAEDGSHRVIDGGLTVSLEGLDRLILVRTGVIDLRCELDRLLSQDGQSVEAAMRVTIAVGRHDSDLMALEERLLNGTEMADRAAARRVLEPAMAEGLRAFVASRSVTDLLNDLWRDALLNELRRAGRTAAFEAGLDIDSLRLEQARIDSLAQREKLSAEMRSRKAIDELRLAEEIVRYKLDGHEARVQRLENLGARLATLRQQFPGLSVGGLVGRLETEHRAEAYETLLGLSPQAQATERLYMAAGRAVYGFTPPDFRTIVSTHYAPPQLGSVRSVRVHAMQTHGAASGEMTGLSAGDLLIGCQFGVCLMSAAMPMALPREYPLPGFARRRDLKGGINATVVAAGWLLATHSEIGLTVWRLDQPGREGQVVRPSLPPADAVRGVCRDRHDRVWLTWNNHILRFDVQRLWELAGSAPMPGDLATPGVEPLAMTSRGVLRPSDAQAATSHTPQPGASNSHLRISMLDGPNSGRQSSRLGLKATPLEPLPPSIDGRTAFEIIETGNAEVTCLLTMDEHVYAGTAAGQVLRWPLDLSRRAGEVVERSSHKIYSLGHAVMGGVDRLLIGDNDYAVRACVPGQNHESRYRLANAAVCFVAGGSDYLFAIDAGQGQVYVWRTDEPERPFGEIAVRRLTQHSAKDMALLSGPCAPGAASRA